MVIYRSVDFAKWQIPRFFALFFLQNKPNLKRI